MASAEISDQFNCTKEQFFKIISDYEKYPEFLNEVKKCTVLKTEKNRKLVEYEVSVVKTFKYRLWMTEKPASLITWTLDSGDMFKVSNGKWELKEKAKNTIAHYSVEAEFKVFVPGMIAKALVQVNLPQMIESYKKRIKEIYGG